MLKARIATAAVLIPIVITLIFFADVIWFSAFFALIVVIGAWEWAGLSKLNDKVKYSYVILSLSILFMIYWFNVDLIYKSAVLIGALYWLIAVGLVIFYQKQRNLLPRNSSILMLVGLLLLVPMWSGLVILKSNTETGLSSDYDAYVAYLGG